MADGESAILDLSRMDHSAEVLQFLPSTDVLREACNSFRSSPRTFTFIALTLILPLSFAILAHSLFTLPVIDLIPFGNKTFTREEWWDELIIVQFIYPVFVFLFSLLSTAAVVFTIASLYISSSVSFFSSLSTIPRVFKHLVITYLFAFLLITSYNLIFFLCVVTLFTLVDTLHTNHQDNLKLFFYFALFCLLWPIHLYITAVSHLASVVSILEPVYGLAAINKSKSLMKGKTAMALVLVSHCLLICIEIQCVFGLCVVGVWIRLGVFMNRSIRVLYTSVMNRSISWMSDFITRIQSGVESQK